VDGFLQVGRMGKGRPRGNAQQQIKQRQWKSGETIKNLSGY
jgi:hypothetical protein